MESLFDIMEVDQGLTPTQKKAEELNQSIKEHTLDTVKKLKPLKIDGVNEKELSKLVSERTEEIEKLEKAEEKRIAKEAQEKKDQAKRKEENDKKELEKIKAAKEFILSQGEEIPATDIVKYAETLKESPKFPFDIYIQDTKVELNLEEGKRYNSAEIKNLVTSKAEYFYVNGADFEYNPKHNSWFVILKSSTKGSAIIVDKNSFVSVLKEVKGSDGKLKLSTLNSKLFVEFFNKLNSTKYRIFVSAIDTELNCATTTKILSCLNLITSTNVILELDKDFIKIKDPVKNIKSKAEIISYNEMPDFKMDGDQEYKELNTNVLNSMLKISDIAIENINTPYYNYIHILDGNLITTNGACLKMLNYNNGLDFNCSIHKEVIKNIAKIIKSDSVAIGIINGSFNIEDENESWIQSTIYGGIVPPFLKLIPENQQNKIILNKEHISMIKNIDNSIIVIESKDGNLVLRNDLNKEKLEYDFNIELESDEDNIGDIVVGFNSKHLKSILNLFDDKDKVEIAFESNIKPFTIKNDNKIALLLPIRGIE